MVHGGSPPWAFVTFQCFEKISSLKGKPVMSSLKDKVYIMGCSIVQNGRHLELYPKLEIIQKKKKGRKLKIFYAGHEEYVVIKNVANFRQHFVLLFHLKQAKTPIFSFKMA